MTATCCCSWAAPRCPRASQPQPLLPLLLKHRWAWMPRFHGDKITLGEQWSRCTGASSGSAPELAWGRRCASAQSTSFSALTALRGGKLGQPMPPLTFARLPSEQSASHLSPPCLTPPKWPLFFPSSSKPRENCSHRPLPDCPAGSTCPQRPSPEVTSSVKPPTPQGPCRGHSAPGVGFLALLCEFPHAPRPAFLRFWCCEPLWLSAKACRSFLRITF